MIPFDDLSGAELRRRLEQRDLHPFDVEVLVAHRDTCPECRIRIAMTLGMRVVDDED